ncbi:MAG: RdgB/HAM1 family non-canonical purine NTP pyrophosphatase [Granulosicoccus sp.]|nr:RdgB/HAM1 family non-canonical purine NTP pyrophosphatase [Granulosicoccus sp.]
MKKGALVFASSNEGKVQELKALLEPLGFEISAQQQFGVDAIEETALTFVENALLKARHASTIAGLPAIADDSGLEIDALDGAPGLYSARYAERHGRGSSDIDNYQLVLEQMADLVHEADRRARFRTVIVYLRHPEDPSPLIAEGTWEGHVLMAPQGETGFGYDPVFCNHDTHCSVALLDKNTKNSLSHRGKAVRAMAKMLTEHAGSSLK